VGLIFLLSLGTSLGASQDAGDLRGALSSYEAALSLDASLVDATAAIEGLRVVLGAAERQTERQTGRQTERQRSQSRGASAGRPDGRTPSPAVIAAVTAAGSAVHEGVGN